MPLFDWRKLELQEQGKPVAFSASIEGVQVLSEKRAGFFMPLENDEKKIPCDDFKELEMIYIPVVIESKEEGERRVNRAFDLLFEIVLKKYY